jgi:hypothetical protein
MSWCFADAREDPEVGVVVLTGEGPLAFCSGGDQSVRGSGGYVGADGIPRLNVLDLQMQVGVVGAVRAIGGVLGAGRGLCKRIAGPAAEEGAPLALPACLPLLADLPAPAPHPALSVRLPADPAPAQTGGCGCGWVCRGRGPHPAHDV